MSERLTVDGFVRYYPSYAPELPIDELQGYASDDESNIETQSILRHEIVQREWQNLSKKIAYLNKDDFARVQQAFEFSATYHDQLPQETRKRFRKSGEPYIIHPIAVTGILADLHVETDLLVASLLHDTLEDTYVSPGMLIQEFGESVVSIVEGVTKVKTSRLESLNEAETKKKIYDAVVEDERIVLLKLADRLHNMRTIHHMKQEKQVEVARQTIQDYIPLAVSLGMYDWADELSMLSYAVLYGKDVMHTINMVRDAWVRGHQNEGNLQRIRDAIPGDPVVIRWDTVPIESFFTVQKEKAIVREDGLADVPVIAVCTDHGFGQLTQQFLRKWEDRKHLQPQERDVYGFRRRHGGRAYVSYKIGPDENIQLQLRTIENEKQYWVSAADKWSYHADPSDKDYRQVKRRYELKMQYLKSTLEQYQAMVRDDEITPEEYTHRCPKACHSEIVALKTPYGDRYFATVDGGLAIAYQMHSEIGHSAKEIRINGSPVPFGTIPEEGDTFHVIRHGSPGNEKWWASFQRWEAFTDPDLRALEWKKLQYIIYSASTPNERLVLANELEEAAVADERQIPDMHLPVGVRRIRAVCHHLDVRDKEIVQSVQTEATRYGLLRIAYLMEELKPRRQGTYHDIAGRKNTLEMKWHCADNPWGDMYRSAYEFLQHCAVHFISDEELTTHRDFLIGVMAIEHSMSPKRLPYSDQRLRDAGIYL